MLPLKVMLNKRHDDSHDNDHASRGLYTEGRMQLLVQAVAAIEHELDETCQILERVSRIRLAASLARLVK